MIERLVLSTEEGSQPGLDRVREEFPSVQLGFEEVDGAPAIELASWRDSHLDFFALDARIIDGHQATRAMALRAPARALPALALEVLTRYQALIQRRNAASRTVAFDRVLERHLELHDVRKPLVRADHQHALDTWQWLVRLDPDASQAAQVAALFHDIERLISEADRRVEQHARDYQAFKDAHARGGAMLLRGALAGLELERTVVERAAELVKRHERPGSDPELALLNDADALSFFSLNSYGYLNYFGPVQTAKKVAYTLNRLRPGQHARLREIRLPETIRQMVEASVPREVSA